MNELLVVVTDSEPELSSAVVAAELVDICTVPDKPFSTMCRIVSADPQPP